MPFGYLQVFSKPPIVIILCVCSRSRQRDIGTGEFQHSMLPASHRVSKLRDCLCSRRQNQRGYKESWSAKPRRLRGEWYKSIVRSQKAGPHRGSQEECSIPVTRRGSHHIPKPGGKKQSKAYGSSRHSKYPPAQTHCSWPRFRFGRLTMEYSICMEVFVHSQPYRLLDTRRNTTAQREKTVPQMSSADSSFVTANFTRPYLVQR